MWQERNAAVLAERIRRGKLNAKEPGSFRNNYSAIPKPPSVFTGPPDTLFNNVFPFHPQRNYPSVSGKPSCSFLETSEK